jgi:methionine salvage enolase-phosphatase E1
MQAVHTKYIPRTDKCGSLIKARCERGSITISYPFDLSGDEVHREAVRQLVARFIKEDEEDGICKHSSQNVWARPFVTGGLPDGTYAHIFVGGAK